MSALPLGLARLGRAHSLDLLHDMSHVEFPFDSFSGKLGDDDDDDDDNDVVVDPS